VSSPSALATNTDRYENISALRRRLSSTTKATSSPPSSWTTPAPEDSRSLPEEHRDWAVRSGYLGRPEEARTPQAVMRPAPTLGRPRSSEPSPELHGTPERSGMSCHYRTTAPVDISITWEAPRRKGGPFGRSAGPRSATAQELSCLRGGVAADRRASALLLGIPRDCTQHSPIPRHYQQSIEST
jgi:hypothetical protein